MGGTSARTLGMNTENSIRKEIGRPMFGLEDYIKMDLKGKYLEEYMVLNMKTGNGKVGRIGNWKR